MIVDLPHTVTSSLYSTFFLPLSHPLFFIKSATPQQATGNHQVETPLFVDSQLTGMVQIADICSYALRRYLENGENELFDKVFKRADRRGKATVGIRHFTTDGCSCSICSGHRW